MSKEKKVEKKMNNLDAQKEIEQVFSDWNLMTGDKEIVPDPHDKPGVIAQLVEIAEKPKEELKQLIINMTCEKCPLYGKSHEDDDGVNKVRNASYCCAWDIFKDWVRDR